MQKHHSKHHPVTQISLFPDQGEGGQEHHEEHRQGSTPAFQPGDLLRHRQSRICYRLYSSPSEGFYAYLAVFPPIDDDPSSPTVEHHTQLWNYRKDTLATDFTPYDPPEEQGG